MALMQKSHVITIGANKKPTLCVPKCWSANKSISMMHAAGTSTSAKHKFGRVSNIAHCLRQKATSVTAIKIQNKDKS